jgi:hypothetical protein
MKKLPRAALAIGMLLGVANLASAQDRDQPMADAHAMHNPAIKSPDKMLHAPLAKGHNSFTMGEARDRLQKAGYENISGLTMDNDGLWQARATRHGHPVQVAVDYKGNVAAQ